MTKFNLSDHPWTYAKTIWIKEFLKLELELIQLLYQGDIDYKEFKLKRNKLIGKNLR